MHMTFTTGKGERYKSFGFDFQSPCLDAASWVMSGNMIISIKETRDSGTIPIIAFHYGTGLGIPPNIAEGIIFEGKPLYTVKHVEVTLHPVASYIKQHYKLAAVYYDAMIGSNCLFEEIVRASIIEKMNEATVIEAMDMNPFLPLSMLLSDAVDRVESLKGKWWTDWGRFFGKKTQREKQISWSNNSHTF